MSVIEWAETPIDRHHDRKGFDCGNNDLNRFLREHARQSHKAGGSKTFVATPSTELSRILGYYSLSPTSLIYSRTPDIVRKGLVRHDVPMFRLARLAVDQSVQQRGLGGGLLLAAARRCMSVAEEVGGVGLYIDAKDEAAAAWYRGYGALPLLDDPLGLVLTFATIKQAFEPNE